MRNVACGAWRPGETDVGVGVGVGSILLSGTDDDEREREIPTILSQISREIARNQEREEEANRRIPLIVDGDVDFGSPLASSALDR